MTIIPQRGSEEIFNVFAQDDIELARRLHLVGGVKLEHNNYTGWEYEPSLRLAWTPGVSQTVWAAVSRAIRMPLIGDEYVRFNTAALPATPSSPPVQVRVLGNPGLQQSERLLAWEAGYRTALTPRLELDLAAFYNSYSRLTSVAAGAPFFEAEPPPPHLVAPQVYGNALKGRSYGLEASANWQVTPRWRLSASYSLLQARFSTNDPAVDLAFQTNVQGVGPHYQVQLRSQLDLPGRAELDAAVYRVGRLAELGVPAYTRLDVRLGWRATDRVSFSLSGRNLLQTRHPEFTPINYGAPTEVPRSVYLSARIGY